jgi:Outer membrane efflux protein
MNVASIFLALSLVGLDDPQSKPAMPAKGSVKIATNADAITAPETVCPDRISEGVKDLKQVDRAGAVSSLLPKLLMRVAKPMTIDGAGAPEVWPMTLQQAIRIGLDNSEIVRVIAFGAQGIPIGSFEPTSLEKGTSAQASDASPAPIVIARLNADASLWRFKAEVMAHERSVEQLYWNLAQAHVQLWAADRAVSLADEIFKREQAELKVGRGTGADVAEANQRLEQFKLDLVTRTSDIITAERQLRFLLGLPPADNRRIVPVTPATEAKFEPVWATSLDEMLEQSPDIVEKKTTIRKLRDAIAIASANVSVIPSPAPAAKPTPDVASDEPVQRKRITQQETELEQAIHQQIHSLARFFLEIDANYKQLQTAKRLRAAAGDRLETQLAYYEEGRITIDRFLDAVSQYATAVGTEAQYKATYNISMVALSEVKGTLLDDYGIVVEEPNKPRKDVAARQTKTDAFAKPAAFVTPDKGEPVPTPLHELIGLGAVTGSGSECCQSKKAVTAAESTAATTSWTFSLTFGSGPNPVQIKGTISADDHAKTSP